MFFTRCKNLVKKLIPEAGPARAYLTMKVAEAASSSWMFSTHILFLHSKGLTVEQIFHVNVIFMFIRVVIDPLTGSLGDKIGQRLTYLIGLGFWGVGMFYYGLGQNLQQFYVAEAIAGIGFALISEALESWLRNTIGVAESHKYIARAGYLGRLASVVPSFVGSTLAMRFALNIPYFLETASTMLLVVFGAFWLFRLPGGKDSNTDILQDAVDLIASLKQGARLVARTPQLRYIMIVSAVSGGCFQPFNQLWSLVFTDLAGGKANFTLLPYMWMMIAVASGIGEFVAEKAGIPKRWMIALWIISMGIPMALTPTTSNLYLVLGLFLAHEVGRGAIRPVMGTYAANYIPNQIRTTAASYLSAILGIGQIIGLFAFGALTNFLSNQIVWLCAGLILILLGFWAIRGYGTRGGGDS